MFDIKKHGDLLEKVYSDFIQSRLSGYNKIWSNFIGNDGTSKMPEIEKLNEKEQEKRKHFSQYHYTCLESIICLYEIVQEADNLSRISFADVSDIKKYMDLMNKYIAFHAHAGRIRDLSDKIGILYELPDLGKDLNEYYQRRNNVLHKSKAPIELIEGIISIITPEGELPDPTKWSSDKLWSDESNVSIEFVEKYLQETFQEILTIFNNCLERLYSIRISQIIKESEIQLMPEEGVSYDMPIVPPSGTGYLE